MLDYDFNGPKRNILKLGKAFDLETIALDDYQMIILATTSGLVLNDLDKFDASMAAYESNPATYTRPNVPLQVTETITGYQIDIAGNNVTIPIEEATIQGLLIINAETLDILAADLYSDPITIVSDLNITYTKPLWVLENVPG